MYLDRLIISELFIIDKGNSKYFSTINVSGWSAVGFVSILCKSFMYTINFVKWEQKSRYLQQRYSNNE